jgi:phage-related protein
MAAIRAIPGLVAGVFTAVWNTARVVVSTGVSAVISFFAQLPGRARAALSALTGIVFSIFSSASNSARSGASSLVSGAISIIRNLPGQIRSALSTVRSAVTGAFAGASSWLVSAGRNLLAGIRNGIVSAIGGAVSAARNAAHQIVNGFKDALKIGSPSKVGETEIGRWIPAGVARGIDKNMGLVDKAIRNIVPDSMIPDIGFKIPAGHPRGGDGAGMSRDVHLTIQSGAIVINGQGADSGQAAAEAVLERLGQIQGLM